MVREMTEKTKLIETLENLKGSEHTGYDVGYNVGVEDCIRIIVDMYEPKLIITRLEYELLKRFNNLLYKYIARDKDGTLFIYKDEPQKKKTVWGSLYGHKIVNEADLFKFVEWSDNEPFSIEKLLCECEVLEDD